MAHIDLDRFKRVFDFKDQDFIILDDQGSFVEGSTGSVKHLGINHVLDWDIVYRPAFLNQLNGAYSENTFFPVTIAKNGSGSLSYLGLKLKILDGDNFTVLIDANSMKTGLEQFRDLPLLAEAIFHDINNPMQTVGLHLSLMNRRLEDAGGNNEALMRSLEIIEREFGRLTDMVKSFQQFCELPVPPKSRNSLNIFLDLLSQDLGFARGIELVVASHSELPDVWIDEQRLLLGFKRLFKNLDPFLRTNSVVRFDPFDAPPEAGLRLSCELNGSSEIDERVLFGLNGKNEPSAGLQAIRRLFSQNTSRNEIVSLSPHELKFELVFATDDPSAAMV